MCKIGAIILAAGKSERMNEAKLLLQIHKQSMIQHVVHAASHPKISQIVIVTGAYADKIKKQIQPTNKIMFIHNEHYSKGIGTSLGCGMREMSKHVDATFVFLADQPFVSRYVIDTMIHRYITCDKNKTQIIRPSYQGKEGHPILFSSDLFPLFFQLTGDVGGKEIVNTNRDAMDVIQFTNELWGRDIDTPSDFNEMRKYSVSNLEL